MTSPQNTRSKAPKLPRITVSLEEFPEKIIGKLVGFEGQTKSEVIRNIVKVWIRANSDKIQNVYGIKFQDVRRELELIKEEKQLLYEPKNIQNLAMLAKDHILLNKDNVVFTGGD